MKLKNNIYALLSVLCILIVTSCADDFIETVPENNIEGLESQLSSPARVQNALLGMYNDLQDADLYSGTMTYFLGMWADELSHRGSFNTFAQFAGNNPDSENVTNNNMWDAFYDTIFAANNLIENVDPNIAGQDLSDRVRGQAYGIRALMYFNLVRMYGPVPLELVPNRTLDDLDASSNLPRSSVNDIYASINSDIAEALSLLPNGGIANRAVNRFSRDAVLTLQAQVALQLNDLGTAQTVLETLLTAGYTLAPVEDLYGDENAGLVLNPLETIFGISYSVTDGSQISFFFSDQPDSGRDEVGIGAGLNAGFEADDMRQQFLFYPISGTNRVSKYTRGGDGNDDVYVFRYADVLLMLAEVYARQNNPAASGLINQVRTRAGLANVTLDSSNFETLIPAERLVEFYAEGGDRYFTLKRLGLLDAVVQAKGTIFIAERNNLFPIPQNELDNNTALTGADQNPGY